MNEKNDKDLEQNAESDKVQTFQKKKEKLSWGYCPACGSRIPKLENLRFCTACGLDLLYIKENKEIPPQFQQHYAPLQPHFQQPEHISQNQYAYPYPSQYPSHYPQKREYHSLIDKLSDEEITKSKDKILWGFWPSLLIPLAAFILMNLILIGILIVIVLIVNDLNIIYNLIDNPYFLIATTLIELVLTILPLLYIKKYLRNPSIKNRLKLLGFTTEGYDDKAILKEVLIGVVFAIIGISLVAGVSIAIELIIYFINSFNNVETSATEVPADDVDVLLSGADIIVLILMMILMILLVGPTEEILFRGFMQKGLVRNIGDKGGIIITALIFAIIHIFLYILILPFVFIILFFPYFAVSLMLGLLYRWRNENLIAVIVTHGLYNALTLLFAFLYYVFN
ncbi:MAG: CPBP family glutamic-type intramembrane protease [Promethearchaeota archaeon]